MESLVQALGRSRAECMEFSTLRKNFEKKSWLMVSGTLRRWKKFLSGTSRRWSHCCDVEKHASLERHEFSLNVTTLEKHPL